MRIEGLRTDVGGGKARVSATVIWEDSGREPQEIYFEVPDEPAAGLVCNPDAFLVGCLVPAVFHGEKRLRTDEPVCPELSAGLENAMCWLHAWMGARYTPLRLEVRPRLPLDLPGARGRTGAFFSGGVDSLAMLCLNRRQFPAGHPRAIRACVFVHGFDIGHDPADPRWDSYTRALEPLTAAADELGMDVVTVATNVRHLDSGVQLWVEAFVGSALASVAHALVGQMDAVYIASDFRIPLTLPYGSHPLLDACYQSANLRILRDGLRLTRLEKVALIADWDAALGALRPCTGNAPGMINCGRCEKCVRTMLELMVAGKLGQARTFAVHDVTPEVVAGVDIWSAEARLYMGELIAPLRALGRRDLAEPLADKCAEYDRHLAWQEERDWKGVVKRFDRKYLGGALFDAYAGGLAAVTRRPGPRPS